MKIVVIVVIIAVIVIFASREAIKHMKGEGGCCGGGGGIIEDKKKLDKPEIGKEVLKIEGMHCDNCRVRVQNALNRIDGAAAKVDLKKSEAVIRMSREISREEFRKVIEEAGYTLL